MARRLHPEPSEEVDPEALEGGPVGPGPGDRAGLDQLEHSPMVVKDCAQIVGVSESVEEDGEMFEINLNALVGVKKELRCMKHSGDGTCSKCGAGELGEGEGLLP